MVEALKHLKKDKLDINNYLVEAKTRINYKNFVSQNTDYENLVNLTKRNWFFIISENLKRCLFLFEI
ncbi:NOL1/NOP2/sun family protein, partial [Fusobacterium animalis ATCC 51191]